MQSVGAFVDRRVGPAVFRLEPFGYGLTRGLYALRGHYLKIVLDSIFEPENFRNRSEA